jgi:hypothetical protein
MEHLVDIRLTGYTAKGIFNDVDRKIGDEFEPEFLALPQEVQDEAFTMVRLSRSLALSSAGRASIRSRIRATRT